MLKTLSLPAKITAAVAVLALFMALFTIPVAAQPARELCEGSGGTWNGSECVRAGETGIFAEGGLVHNIINAMIFLVGILAVIMLIVGAIRYVVSGGDANAVSGAKNTIMYAIVGIIVAAAAFGIVNFVVNQLG